MSDPDTVERWEVERDRFGVMFSGPLEVGECKQVVPAATLERAEANAKRLKDEQRSLMDKYDELHREARELWDALVACAEYAPNDVKILIDSRKAIEVSPTERSGDE